MTQVPVPAMTKSRRMSVAIARWLDVISCQACFVGNGHS